VISHHFPIVWIQQRWPFAAQQNLVPRFFKVGHRHLIAIVPRGDQRGFIAQVRQIGAAQTGGRARQCVQIDVGIKCDVPRMNLQNAGASASIRQRDSDLSIETTRAQEGGIKYIGAIGGRQNDDLVPFVEAVHFDQ
jgi:hypothetical protein